MSKIKKSILFFVIVAAVSSGLISCSGYKDSNLNKTKLVVGDWPTEEGRYRDGMFDKKNAFEKKYPNVEIVPDAWFFDLKSCYLKAEAGMLPNVFLSPFTEMSSIIEGGYAKDITNILKERKIYDDINESIKDVVSMDGKIYAIPNTVYAFGIKYNVEAFKKAGLISADGVPMQPKTWEELAEFAVKIKETTGKSGFAMCTTDKCGGWMLTNIAWSYGVEFMRQEEDGRWTATFDTDEMAQALNYIKDLRWKYDVLPSSVLINRREIMEMFALGNTAMIISAPEQSELAIYGIKPEEYGILSVPSGPARWVTLVGGNARHISAKTDEAQVLAALDWIEFENNSYLSGDDYKNGTEKRIEQSLKEGIAVGIKGLSIWDKDCYKSQYRDQLVDENSNMIPNAAKWYDEALQKGTIELQMEEKMCAQDLYAILDNCIQEVLVNKNANCREIVKKANYDFQTNFLDNKVY